MFKRSMVPVSCRLTGLLILGGVLTLSAQQQPSAAASPQRSLINQYCVSCHSDKLKTGGLVLENLNVDNVAQNPEVWEKVLHKLSARYMPPPGLPKPDEKGYQSMVTYLETSLDKWAASKPNPGRTASMRRLTRTEYHNAIRDLLGLDIDATQMLPSDETSYGFDNTMVEALSPTLLERYLTAARKIARLALGSKPRGTSADTIMIPGDLTQERHMDELPFGTHGGTAVNYIFPQDAEYEISLRLTRDRNEHIEGLTGPTPIELMIDKEHRQTFVLRPNKVISGIRNATGIPSDELLDRNLRIRIPVKAGTHEIGVTFPREEAFLLLENEHQPYQSHFNMYRHPRVQPALDSITVVGPYDPTGAGDTPSRRKLFVCRPAKPAEEDACAKKVLSAFARRAYRRPIADADLQVPLKLYQDGREAGGFDAGIERGLRALLVSPEFLFRVERDPAGVQPKTPYKLTDLDLASRLSFFLWSSVPDDELLDLGIRGKLREPATLEKQVKRMLADSRAQAMVTSFADQWLYLRNLDAIIPDARAFPDYDDNLRQSMKKETELFFGSIMSEDRNVLDLISANYSFVNERLAKHYGIPKIYDSYFRRVTFDPASGRGGLLGQGAILTVTSYPDRTSPVIRGKWILSNIVGSPPPPPPPNVPPLKPNGTTGKVMTMRERMAAHRVNQPCAGCHRLMDPVGFSLENFDAVGRYRINDQDSKIDSSGNLPDGVAFTGVDGLKKAVLARPELFVGTVAEKMLIYGLGRGLEPSDGTVVRKIVRDARAGNFRFSSIVLGIVNSTPFQMRRSS